MSCTDIADFYYYHIFMTSALTVEENVIYLIDIVLFLESLYLNTTLQDINFVYCLFISILSISL